MARLTDKGHAKNVTSFDELISVIDTYGESFNPAREALKSLNLRIQARQYRDALDAVNSAFSNYSKAIIARESGFEPLNKLVTRVANSVKSTESADHVYQSTMTLVRKIQGRRATPKRTKEEVETDLAAGNVFTEKSASQMSYDSRLENLNKLVQLISGFELYGPNEADLKVEGLSDLYKDLAAKNQAVITASSQLNDARMKRDNAFYKENGLVEVGSDTKAYIKSVFGADSPKYKLVSKIEFRKQ